MRIWQVFGLEITINDLFSNPVLADLAGAVQRASRPELPAIRRREEAEALRLSFAQQRLWILAQMEGVSEAYHIVFGVELKGELDAGALRRALDRILERHEALRTTFGMAGDQPVQHIASAEQSRFQLIEDDLRGHPESERELEQLVSEARGARFDLEVGPLIRGRLVRLKQDEHALLISMHHIISDGWSMGVLVRELSALYGAYRNNQADPLPPLEIQYGDYAMWQRKWIDGEILQRQAEYWKKMLAGAPAVLEVPMDHARPAQQDSGEGW